MIQPNTDMTGTGSDCVGIVMLTVRLVATKSAKGVAQYKAQYLPTVEN